MTLPPLDTAHYIALLCMVVLGLLALDFSPDKPES